MQPLNAKSKHLVSASEAHQLIGCSRSHVERLQLQGKLTPVPTIHPKYYFRYQEVIQLKKKLTSKRCVK